MRELPPHIPRMSEEERSKHVWRDRSKRVPVILRRTGKGKKLRLRLPYAEDNREWLRHGRRNEPVYDREGKFWEVPKAWFNELVDRALKDYDEVYILQPYREMEICAPACMEALGHICECSCMGANHGIGMNNGSWYVASDAFAFRWGNARMACRHLIKGKAPLRELIDLSATRPDADPDQTPR